jgi:alpha-D-ribose 1-methylphosphonate 5-phosphate C-P lyase
VVPDDVVKVYDQGDDDSMNAVAIRDLVGRTTGVATTTDARAATLIQTRHRIPEDPLAEGTVLVFQVPIADPLRIVDPRPSVTRRLHAERDYAPIWLYLYEDLALRDHSSFSHSHPVEVNDSYIMSPSPIPKHDVPKLDMAPFLSLFGAGREATVYAVPPYTRVKPVTFDDRPFEIERTGQACALCDATTTFLVEDDATETHRWICSDVDHCRRTPSARSQRRRRLPQRLARPLRGRGSRDRRRVGLGEVDRRRVRQPRSGSDLGPRARARRGRHGDSRRRTPPPEGRRDRDGVSNAAAGSRFRVDGRR